MKDGVLGEQIGRQPSNRMQCGVFSRLSLPISCPASCANCQPLPSALCQAALHAAKSDKAAMVRATKKADAVLRQLVDITLRTDLTRIQRTNLETCITVHMHQKEVHCTTWGWEDGWVLTGDGRVVDIGSREPAGLPSDRDVQHPT